MPKTHIFDQKNNNKKIFFGDLNLPFFSRPLQETNDFFFEALELVVHFGHYRHERDKVTVTWFIGSQILPRPILQGREGGY